MNRPGLKASMHAVEREGLRLDAKEPEKLASLGALTRILLDILRGPGSARASDAAVKAHELMDLSVGNNRLEREPACRKGCGYCCRVYVSATAPEIFALARAMRALPADRFAAMAARVQAADEATGDRDWSRDLFFTHQCPLLEDNACSMHPERPDACRGVSSYSAQACEASIAALATGRDLAIPRVDEHAVLRGLHAHALWAALRAVGLSHAYYSLNQGLRRVLDMPDAETRWLAGEDVFAAVPKDSTTDDMPQAFVNATMDALIAVALDPEDHGQPR